MAKTAVDSYDFNIISTKNDCRTIVRPMLGRRRLH